MKTNFLRFTNLTINNNSKGTHKTYFPIPNYVLRTYYIEIPMLCEERYKAMLSSLVYEFYKPFD